MAELSRFCTCPHTACPLHPVNHGQGCAPCVAKNLKLREIPNCFFQLIDANGVRTGDSFLDFAELVMRGSAQKEKEE